VNNNDCVFLVETVRGKYRVVGSEAWQVKSTVAQDLGQGATGTTSTTLSVEATDECPAPFYYGKIETEDGTIQPEQASAAAIEYDGTTYTADNFDDLFIAVAEDTNKTPAEVEAVYEQIVAANAGDYTMAADEFSEKIADWKQAAAANP
jgi:hypothetical protein